MYHRHIHIHWQRNEEKEGKKMFNKGSDSQSTPATPLCNKEAIRWELERIMHLHKFLLVKGKKEGEKKIHVSTFNLTTCTCDTMSDTWHSFLLSKLASNGSYSKKR